MNSEQATVQVVVTRLAAEKVDRRLGETLLRPQVNIAMPPALAGATVRGACSRPSARAVWVDVRTKKPEWVAGLAAELQKSLTRDAANPLWVVLAFDGETALPRLEDLVLAQGSGEESAGFGLWEAGATDAEDRLAKMMWRATDYAVRWEKNRGRVWYYPRAQEERQVIDGLNAGTPLLLVGAPLAGKSRLLLRMLLDRARPLWVADAGAKQWVFPTPSDEHTVVFDDLDLFLADADFATAFVDFVQRCPRWVATCRSGEAYEAVTAVLENVERVGETLHTVLIGRLTHAQVAQVAVQLSLAKLPKQRKLPQTIGYYFMAGAVGAWQEVYAKLPPAERAALRAAGLAMRLGATRDLETLDVAVPRALAGAGLPENLADRAFDAACTRLNLAAKGKGWWLFDPVNGEVRLEPVFADRVIDADGGLLAKQMLRDVLSRANRPPLKGMIFADTKALARWAEQAYAQGLKVFERDWAWLQPALGVLQRAKEWDDGEPRRAAVRALLLLWFAAVDESVRQAVFDWLPRHDAHSQGLLITLNQLLADAGRVEPEPVLDLCGRLAVRPDVYTFAILLAHTRDGSEGQALRARILTAMQHNGVAANVVTYNTLLEKSADAAERAKWLGEMRGAKVEPNVVTYTTLLEKSADALERAKWLGEMRDAGVAADVVTYTTLLEKSTDALERAKWLGEMRGAGVAADVVTYTTLLEKSADAAERAKWLGEMRGAGVAADVVTYTTLLDHAHDWAECLALRKEMAVDKVEPNVFSFNNLMKHAPDFATAEALLAELLAAQLKPSTYTLQAMVKQARDFASALQVVKQFQALKVFPNEHVFKPWRRLARSPDELNVINQLELNPRGQP